MKICPRFLIFELSDCTLRIFRGYDFSIFLILLFLDRYFGVFDSDLRASPPVCLVMEYPPGLKSVHSVLAHLGYNSSPLIILSAPPRFSQNRLKNTKTLYCFLTKSFRNVKHVPCIRTKKGVIGNQYNLISICDRISNIGKAISVRSFNVNFPFQS